MKLKARLKSILISFAVITNGLTMFPTTIKATATANAVQINFSVTVEHLKSMQNYILNNQKEITIPMDESMDLNSDGSIDCFDLILLRKMYAEQVEKLGDFYSLSSDVVHENDVKYGTSVMSDDFYSKRVIVKAKS